MWIDKQVSKTNITFLNWKSPDTGDNASQTLKILQVTYDNIFNLDYCKETLHFAKVNITKTYILYKIFKPIMKFQTAST